MSQDDDGVRDDSPADALKLARFRLGQSLAGHPGFCYMGEESTRTRLVVYYRSPIRGLPAVYNGYRVDAVPIQSVRHDEREQEAYERRQDQEG